MNKRGQLYLLAALIIGFIIFIVATPANKVRQTVIEDNFHEIGKNFEKESAKFLNQVIERNTDVTAAFTNFTILFTSYAKTKNPDFGLLYTFVHNNKLYIGNYLHDPITVKYLGTHTVEGCFSAIKTSFSIAGLTLNVPNVDRHRIQQCQLMLNAHGNIVDLSINEEENILKLKVEVTQGNPDLVIVAKEQKGNIRKVYTKGKFL